MSADQKAVDVLAVIHRVAMFNGGLIADDLERVQHQLSELFRVGLLLSANLEHSIALANPGDVSPTHPLRVSLNEFDAALARCGGAS